MDSGSFSLSAPVAPRLEQSAIKDFAFENGARLERLTIGYASWGALNDARDNAVLLFHGAASERLWAAPFIRAGGAFDPESQFIIAFDAIGGGASSKPSDGLGVEFPHYSIADIVSAQAAIVFDQLGLSRIRAVAGASMGAMTALEWCSRFPDLVGAAALIVPGHRCDAYARSVFAALEAMITLDPLYREGRYSAPPTEGVRRAGAIMLTHVLSRPFLETLSPDAVAEMRTSLGERYAHWDANDLIWRYRAVASWDFAERHKGLAEFAATIRCPTLFLPSVSDLIFPIEEVQALADLLPRASWGPLQSALGHMAGACPPGSPEFEMMDRTIRSFLDAL